MHKVWIGAFGLLQAVMIQPGRKIHIIYPKIVLKYRKHLDPSGPRTAPYLHSQSHWKNSGLTPEHRGRASSMGHAGCLLHKYTTRKQKSIWSSLQKQENHQGQKKWSWDNSNFSQTLRWILKAWTNVCFLENQGQKVADLSGLLLWHQCETHWLLISPPQNPSGWG